MTEKEQELAIKPSDVKDIYQANSAVMGEVGYVRKQKTAGLNYTFAGEAAFIKAIRPFLVEYGIVITPEIVSDIESREYRTKSDTLMTNISLTVTYRWTHAPSGTFTFVSSRGEGSDSGDKAGNKALTGAYKYAIRQSLVIETGDDPDNFASASQERNTEMKPAVKTATKSVVPTTGKNFADLVLFAGTYNMKEDDVRSTLREAGFATWDTTAYSAYQKAIISKAPAR